MAASESFQQLSFEEDDSPKTKDCADGPNRVPPKDDINEEQLIAFPSPEAGFKFKGKVLMDKVESIIFPP